MLKQTILQMSLQEHFDVFAIAQCKVAQLVRLRLSTFGISSDCPLITFLACVQGSVGTPGSLNFDLCDDLAGGSGGKELRDKAEDIWMPSSATLKEDSDCAVQ